MDISLSRMTRVALSTLGSMIKIARSERNMSQADLAKRINVSRYSVMALEKGDPKVAIGVVFEAAWIVGVPLLAQDFKELQKLAHTINRFNAILPERIRHKRDLGNDNF